LAIIIIIMGTKSSKETKDRSHEKKTPEKAPKTSTSKLDAVEKGKSTAAIEAVVEHMSNGYHIESISKDMFKAYFAIDIIFVERLFDFARNFNSSTDDFADSPFLDHRALRIISILFITLVELLLLEPGQFNFEEVKDFDFNPIEIFTAIILNKLWDKLRDFEISSDTAVQIIGSAIELVSQEKLSSICEQGIQRLFENHPGGLTCDLLYSTYRDNFEYGRMSLKDGFRDLLLRRSSSLPTFKSEGQTILNQSILAMMRLASNKITTVKELHLLYNSLQSGCSFNRLANGLVAYSAPSFLLIRHSYKTIDGQTVRGILGAIIDSEWKDELGYWGSPNSVIFSLAPKTKFYYGYKGKGENNYVYLSTTKISNSKFPTGLGFGGTNYKDFRIWLDDELLHKSKTHGFDNTYPVGDFSDSYEEYLKVGVK
jgi:hypothetical protein